jgi:hypothetical protein
MSSKNTPDLLDLERDIPTTPEDVRALRQNRPQPVGDWWELLTKLAQQVPNLEELRRRRPTFAGCEPFEL